MRRHHQKFNARKARVGNEVFDSALEAECYLRIKQAADEGWLSFTRQDVFVIIPALKYPGGKKENGAVYTADFQIEARGFTAPKGIYPALVIDCKSPATAKLPDYVLRRKLMWHVHRVEIIEIHSIGEMEKLLANLRQNALLKAQ